MKDDEEKGMIALGWEEFADKVIPDTNSAERFEQGKIAFLGGSALIHNLILKAIENESDQATYAEMNSLDVEMKEIGKKYFNSATDSDATLSKLGKQVQTRRVNRAWKSFVKLAFKDINKDNRLILKVDFMAGAIFLFNEMLDNLDSDDVEENEAMEYLDTLAFEVSAIGQWLDKDILGITPKHTN